MLILTRRHWRLASRAISSTMCVLMCLGIGACGTVRGTLFDPSNRSLGWPPPPDAPRVVHVGELASDRDMKPGRSFFGNVGAMLFGRDAERTMVSPMGVCTDADERVFVCDSGERTLHVFDLARRTYAQWQPSKGARAFLLPIAVAVGESGRVFVSDAALAVIHVFDSDGSYHGTLGEGNLIRPCGIAVDATKNQLIVADPGAHQIVVLSIDDTVEARIGSRGAAPGEFNFPTYVALDRAGQLYVSDSMNFRVQVFDRDFKIVRTIGSKGDLPGYFSQPKGVAFDPDGNLYVVDGNFETVQLFDSSGRLLMRFGEEGHGPGQFWLPVGIHIDAQGRIWVADSYNRRVHVFDYLVEGSP